MSVLEVFSISKEFFLVCVRSFLYKHLLKDFRISLRSFLCKEGVVCSTC
jgi:hypothetical protein